MVHCWSVAATGAGLFLLFWILGYLLFKGASTFSIDLFTLDTPPPGSAGGLANAIVGSLLITGVGILIATPIGILAGTFLIEYGRGSKLAEVIRFVNDMLVSAPSIIVGLFVYEVAGRALPSLLGLGRRRLARDHRAADHRAHHRRTCCSWCPTRCARRPMRWARRNGG